MCQQNPQTPTCWKTWGIVAIVMGVLAAIGGVVAMGMSRPDNGSEGVEVAPYYLCGWLIFLGGILSCVAGACGCGCCGGKKPSIIVTTALVILFGFLGMVLLAGDASGACTEQPCYSDSCSTLYNFDADPSTSGIDLPVKNAVICKASGITTGTNCGKKFCTYLDGDCKGTSGHEKDGGFYGFSNDDDCSAYIGPIYQLIAGNSCIVSGLLLLIGAIGLLSDVTCCHPDTNDAPMQATSAPVPVAAATAPVVVVAATATPKAVAV